MIDERLLRGLLEDRGLSEEDIQAIIDGSEVDEAVFEPYDYDEDDPRAPLPDGTYFADPGGNSALRAATPGNPRNLPCPSCREPNRLTPADRARGYQCDSCSDAAERGY